MEKIHFLDGKKSIFRWKKPFFCSITFIGCFWNNSFNTRLGWTQSSLDTLCQCQGLVKCQQMLGHSFLWKGPRFLWTHPRGHFHHRLRMRGKPGNFLQGKSRNVQGKEAVKEPQGFCPSGRAGKCSAEHEAGRRWADSSSVCQGLRKDAATLLSESWVGDLAVWMATKSPLGQPGRENPLDWHSLNVQTWKGGSMTKTCSGLFVLSGSNKRQDDGVVLSNQRRECCRGKI